MFTLHTRTIAEHLSTFASLLEAEAMRANTLGLKGSRDIAHQAHEARRMADQLWEANTSITLEDAAKSTAHGKVVAHRAVH